MRRRSCAQGSALIMVMFIMTALVLYSTTVWHTTTYVIESMRSRVEGEQNARFIEAVLQWGVSFSKAHYKELIKSGHEVELAFGPLPPRNKENYCACVILMPHGSGNSVKIKAELIPQKMSFAKLTGSCSLIHEQINDTATFSVRDWQWS